MVALRCRMKEISVTTDSQIRCKGEQVYPRVGVIAQVPAEAQCLSTTLPSLRQLGELILFTSGAGADVAAAARRLDVSVICVPWRQHYGELFTDLAERLGDGPWVLAYADETVAVPGHTGWADAPGPLAAGVRHRISDRDVYPEENEPRGAGVGSSPVRFGGLVYPQVRFNGVELDPDELPHTGIVLEHHPAKWPDLSAQRLARTAEVYRASLESAPDDTELLYGLFHCHYSAHQWAEVRDFASRWRAAADDDDVLHALVDYFEACAVIATGDPTAALQLIEAAVTRAPQFADGWYLRGELLAARGRDTEADRSFSKAAEIGRRAHPVAVEDYSLATWRPLAARAALAKRAGSLGQAKQLLTQARSVRAEMRQQITA